MDYEIRGEHFPTLLCRLRAGEQIITQTGSMSWHTKGICVLGENRSGLSNMIKKALSNDNSTEIVYQAYFEGQEITLSSKMAGKILPVNIEPNIEGLIVHNNALMAHQNTVELDSVFQKKLGIGFFGGEGFVMLRLTGKGLAFLEVNGSLHEHTLESGDKLVISAGHLVAMDYTCRISVEGSKNLRKTMFGDEGAWNTTVYGPGKVYLQSMPLINLKSALGFGSQPENK